MINEMPISDVRKKFYITILQERHNLLNKIYNNLNVNPEEHINMLALCTAEIKKKEENI